MSRHDQHPEPADSLTGQGETFETILRRRLSRRAFLKGSAVAFPVILAACGEEQAAPPTAPPATPVPAATSAPVPTTPPAATSAPVPTTPPAATSTPEPTAGGGFRAD